MIPEDFYTHRRSWRSAIEFALRASTDEASKSYWKHELNAFDEAYNQLNLNASTNSLVICPECDGSGLDKEDNEYKCINCEGSGRAFG